MKKFKSLFLALDIKYQDKPIALDTVFCNAPAISDSSIFAQMFVCTKTLVTSVYRIKADEEFINMLKDNIREREEMSILLSDRDQVN